MRPLEAIQQNNKEFFGYTDEQIRMVSFIYWFCHLMERQLKKLLLTMVEGSVVIKDEHAGPIKTLLDTAFDETSLTGKVKIFEKVVDPGSIDGLKDFISLHKQLIDLRNRVAHMKTEDLKYGGEDLLSESTQQKMYDDLSSIIGRIKAHKV